MVYVLVAQAKELVKAGRTNLVAVVEEASTYWMLVSPFGYELASSDIVFGEHGG